MAIGSTAVWEVRTTGATTAGGFYIPGSSGTDFSQQASAQYALTGMTTAGADAILLTASAAADMVGNGIQIISGTNFTAGFYQILSVVVGVSITLDRNVATAAGALGVGNIGGALADMENAAAAMTAGNFCYVKAGTYTRTTSWALTLDGAIGFLCTFIGYDNSRTIDNSDTKPLITTATNSTPLIAGNGASYLVFRNLSFSNTASTRSSVASNATAASGTGLYFVKCKFDGFTHFAPGSGTAANTFLASFYYCEFGNFSLAVIDLDNAANSVEAFWCFFHDCAAEGILHTQTGSTVPIRVHGCVFDAMGTYGVSLTRATTSQQAIDVKNSVFYNCASGGINLAGNSGVVPVTTSLLNNIFWGGTYGIRQVNAGPSSKLVYDSNAFGNQGTAARLNYDAGNNEITLTADPFVDAANGNFALNNTSGGGVLLRALGFPSVMPGGLTANYSDVGVAQHQEVVSGGETSYTFIG